VTAFTDFVEGLDIQSRASMERIRQVALAEAPDAEDGISYGIPALRWHGKPLLGFKNAQKHLSIHPFSADVIAACAELLRGVDHAKGTVRFTAAEPLSDELIRALVQHRMVEIAGSAP